MGKLKDKLTSYKNFWLIWLNCAGKPDTGESLFQIQMKWGIKTNYLYHNERGIGKPLYIRMIAEGYLKKFGRKLVPRFEWISDFIKEEYAARTGNAWFPSAFIGTRWPLVQQFIEKHAGVVFDVENLSVLYKNSRDCMGEYGRYIFTDIFLYVLFANLIVFVRKYHADIVMRILSTFMAVFSDRDMLNYFRMIHSKIVKEVPVIINDEGELNRVLYPYKW